MIIQDLTPFRAIRVAAPVLALDDLEEERQKGLSVCVIRVESSARVAATRPMRQSARKCETQGACHGSTRESGESKAALTFPERSRAKMIFQDLTLICAGASWAHSYGHECLFGGMELRRVSADQQ